MTHTNPCEELQKVHRQFSALGAAEFALRSMFSDGDEFTPRDRTICGQLEELEYFQFRVAQDLLTAKRRRDAWLRKQREEAAKQVADSE
mgnify:CR=1 FL=1|tara:strand:+ start:1734 stop:2000 length:267 start_codon:yes stop_codon:yes gene_type:complete